MPKTVIFDFDGTIADTLGNVIDIYNRICHEFKAKPINADELDRLRNGDYRALMKEHHISIFKFPRLIRRVQAELQNEISNIKPHLGLIKELKKLKADGYVLGILTSNSKENVDTFLRAHSLTHLFEFVESYKHLFKKEKMLKKIIKSRGLDNSNVVYIGDETRDIKAAVKAHLKSIAVSWGFNSGDILFDADPDVLIDKIDELIPAVKKVIS